MTGAALPAADVCRWALELQDRRPYHVAALWRAESFVASEGRPMAERRALALNAVLDRCDLPVLPGELLLGSGIGRLAESGDADALAAAREVLAAIGSRHFGTGFDHLAPDYPALLAVGIAGLRRRAEESRKRHRGDRRAFLDAIVLALDGLSAHLRRWAAAARVAALGHPAQAALLERQAAMLDRLSTEPPATFWEALQLVLITHCAFQLDERYAMALGRLDQYLHPFYQADVAAGSLAAGDAQTLLDHLFAKLAHRGDIQNICLGGVDARGENAVNDLSMMCLDAVRRIGQPGGNVTARIGKGTPDAFLHKCAEVIRTGIGFPAVFNDEVQIPALVAQGYPLEHARDYCFVGCIEAFIPGKQGPWSDGRFNLLHCVDLALRNGADGLTGRQLGPQTGEPATWEAFYEAFLAQMRAGLAAHVRAVNDMKRQAEDRAADLVSPLMSALVEGCIERGLDVCMGGALYPSNHGIAGMGIGSVADSLMAVKRFVYDHGAFTLGQLRQMLDANFENFEAERQLLLGGAPKYGNDDPEVDALAVETAAAFGRECLRYRTPRGGHYWALMGANISNIYAGREVGATPDGRLARQPLSDAASPTFGRDLKGPTAVVRSVAKLRYELAPGGNVVNMKLSPRALAGERGLANLAALIRTCFELGGIQLQFNTTDRELLRRAMAEPEEHRGLVVRVSGFSAYFVGLDRAVQEDILARTEHSFA